MTREKELGPDCTGHRDPRQARDDHQRQSDQALGPKEGREGRGQRPGGRTPRESVPALKPSPSERVTERPKDHAVLGSGRILDLPQSEQDRFREHREAYALRRVDGLRPDDWKSPSGDNKYDARPKALQAAEKELARLQGREPATVHIYPPTPERGATAQDIADYKNGSLVVHDGQYVPERNGPGTIWINDAYTNAGDHRRQALLVLLHESRHAYQCALGDGKASVHDERASKARELGKVLSKQRIADGNPPYPSPRDIWDYYVRPEEVDARSYARRMINEV